MSVELLTCVCAMAWRFHAIDATFRLGFIKAYLLVPAVHRHDAERHISNGRRLEARHG